MAATIQTANSIIGEGRILIMKEGTMKMPLPMMLPMTMPKQLVKESWYERSFCNAMI
jgi:hypothetical protein